MSIPPAWCAEAWVAHQILSNLGYPAEELFFSCVSVVDQGPCIVVSLKRCDKEFVWALVAVPSAKPEDASGIEATWSEYVRHTNELSRQERKEIWDTSDLIRGGKFPGYIVLARALAQKGIDVPEFGSLVGVL